MEWLIFACIPLMALLYAIVGHGGASAYLALMALLSFSPESMRPTALILNLFVAGISFIQFWRAGYFKPKLFGVFALSSIPFSYLGGLQEVDENLYKKILGLLLLFAIARMLGVFGKSQTEREVNWPIGLIVGAAIGYLSGLIGIGGGIILSPVILLLGWGNVKETAAVSALFIWVNSLAGLLGQIQSGIVVAKELYLLLALAIVGGIIGATLGSKKISFKNLNWILCGVLILASVKLLFL